jgi:hypothetical protein
MIGAIRDRVDVRSHLSSLFTLVTSDNLVRVDGELFIGIDCDQEEARVGLSRGN